MKEVISQGFENSEEKVIPTLGKSGKVLPSNLDEA